MYKVLIADDENIICMGLAGMVSKHPKLQVVAMAEDGEIALEKATETRPDLMFVDINMPFLNGLEFIEKIISVLPEAVIIIVTGYDDFEFVQKALRLGVADYVLKPVMEEPFFEVLEKAVNRLEGLDKSKKYMDWVETQMAQVRPTMLNDFFYNWVSGRMDEDEMIKQMHYLNIQIPSTYLLTLIHIYKDFDKDNIVYTGDGNDDPLRIECSGIVKECYEPYSEIMCFRTDDGALVVISKLISLQQWEELNEILHITIEDRLNAKIVINQRQGSGISEVTTIYNQLMDEYNSQKHYSEVVLKAISTINSQWSNSELSLQSVADSLYVSAPYLSRSFSKEIGENFASYLTRKRINEAMWLLKNSNLKMYEVAEKTGYTSQHYFSNTFKKALGISPADYRKEVLK